MIDNGGCKQICINTAGSYKCKCRAGFVLHSDQKDCKEETKCITSLSVSEKSDEITSPGFESGQYKVHSNCTWNLSITQGHRIRLRWETFELEHHPECGYDRVKLCEPNCEKDRKHKTICGQDRPTDYVSEGETMALQFYSDGTVNRRGFKVQYQWECGQTLIAKPKSDTNPRYIYSHPSYGGINYPAGKDCTWVIQAAQNNRSKHHPIVLTFEAFEVEHEPECNYDYLQISSYGRETQKICEPRKGKEKMILSLPVTIKFHSDDTISKKGFKLRYELKSRDMLN